MAANGNISVNLLEQIMRKETAFANSFFERDPQYDGDGVLEDELVALWDLYEAQYPGLQLFNAIPIKNVDYSDSNYPLWRKPVLHTLDPSNIVLDAYKRKILFSLLEHLSYLTYRYSQFKWVDMSYVEAADHLLTMNQQLTQSEESKDAIEKSLLRYSAFHHNRYYYPKLDIDGIDNLDQQLGLLLFPNR